jgi:ABC-type uncharacterized transport system involved in gliding motility auxiliary subunit
MTGLAALRQRFQGVAAIALAAVLAVLVILLAERGLRGMRLDLTENNLYTLSSETRSLLDRVDRPVTLTLYFSRGAARGVPHVRQYARRIEELLRSYAAASDGRIEVRTVEPEPLTQWRERAVQHGLQPVPAGGKDTRIYLGLVGTNDADGVEVIEFFDPRRERLLEYEISRLVGSLARSDEPVVGLLSRRDMTESIELATGRQQPPWAVVDRIKSIAEVREIDPPAAAIDPAVDVLMLVHPHDLGVETRYAIDQYLTHGGRAVVFLDPVAGTATPRSGSGVRRSDLAPLLDAWGVSVALDRALADPQHGLVVSRGRSAGRSVHPALIGVPRAHLAERDVVTAAVDRVVFASPGAIRDRPAGLRVEPLVRLPPSAGFAAAQRFTEVENPAALGRDLAPTRARPVVAARLTGELRSAFPQGPPEQAQAPEQGHRAAAARPAHLVLFADSDVLSDRLWVRQQRQGQRTVRRAWAGNGDLVAKTVENLAGAEALIGLRGKATSARPFTRVRELERRAANRLGDERSRLRDELDRAEQRLQQLQSGGKDEAAVVLDDSQRRELERLRERRAKLRERLRALNQRVEAAVDALGQRLKLLNIVAVPALVVLAGLAVFGWRRWRRRHA